MPSFDLHYDEQDDLLEVRFAPFEVSPRRTFVLNDNIELTSDRGLESALGLTFYSFSRLLLVSETEFTNLQELPEGEAQAVLSLLSRGPASEFFVLTDPDSLVARVRGPSLESLIGPE